MNKTLIIVTVVLIPLIFHSCAQDRAESLRKMERDRRSAQEAARKAQQFAVRYDVKLVAVERSQNAKQNGQVVISEESGKAAASIAEDDLIFIAWMPPGASLGFEILNKSAESVKIIWDEASYVDIGNNAHRVIHSGVKLADRNSLQPVTVVPSKGRISDMVYPSDSITYGWSQPPMFRCSDLYGGGVCSTDQDKQHAMGHKGLIYRVVLPLQLDKEVYGYTFVFKIDDVKILQR